MQNWEVMNTLKPALLSLSPQSKEMQVIRFETNKQKACYLSDKQARWVQVEGIEKREKKQHRIRNEIQEVWWDRTAGQTKRE